MKLPYRILVLDDDENALSGIVELLCGAEYAAVGVATFDEAKALLTDDTFDLLITDVRLRGYNGLHLVRQIHAERFASRCGGRTSWRSAGRSSSS